MHLVGLRDGTDDQRDQMRRRERECLARFGLEPHDEELAALECGDLSPLFQGRCASIAGRSEQGIQSGDQSPHSKMWAGGTRGGDVTLPAVLWLARRAW